MTAIRVRHVDVEVMRRFARRARAGGRSPEEEARSVLVQAVKAGCSAEIRKKFLRDVTAIQRRYPARPDDPAEVLVRRDRDRGRREL